jgi:hypothetical protein
MMAPNWSFKAEALYYDLGSVTVRGQSTSSLTPITAPITNSGFGFDINGVSNANIANHATIAIRLGSSGGT